ncbi:MAG TPA: glycosyltransferase family 39 protein, partial [Blastocatellia bacterium]
MLESIIWVILHLLALALIVLAAFGVGRLMLGRVNFHSPLERATFTIAVGLGAIGLALFFFGLAGALYSGVIFALTAAGNLSALIFLARQREQIKSTLRSLTLARASLILLGLFCWAFVLWPTFFPPNEWDATSNHLLLAREYLSTHTITVPEGIPHPVLPALNHLLFTWGMAIKDDILAQMIEHVLMMLVAAGIYSLGQRSNQRAWGFAAAAFWLAHPLVLWLGQSAYVDIGATAFAFLGVAALRNFFESREKSWWLMAMSLMGMAAGVKMPGLFFVAAGAMIGVWAVVKSRIDWKELIQGCALAFVVAAPFYALIAYHTGNPLWPVLPYLSQGIWADPSIARFNNWINNVGVAKTPINFLLLPFYLSFQLERFLPEPRINRLIIFWPIAWVISFRDREVRWWTLWALT